MTDRTADDALAALGLSLPEVPAPVANYVPYVVSGNLLFVSGQISRNGNETIRGRLGDTMDTATGAAAAQTCGLALIAQVRAACGGDLGKLRRVVKLTGFVASAPGFHEQPVVVNGTSNLMVEVFGDRGRHARSAVGVAALPQGAAVEVEGIFEIEV